MGKGRGKGKNVNMRPVQPTQGAIKNQKSSSTENSNEKESDQSEQYVPTSGFEVPAEETSFQRITKFFEIWGHWVAWFGFVAIFTISYANFDNDVKNSKQDISELKTRVNMNYATTIEIEKQSVKHATEINFIRNDISNINSDIGIIENGLKEVELEQARRQ